MVDLAWMNKPAYGEEHVKYMMEHEIIPPGEKKQGFGEQMLFTEALTLAIYLKDEEGNPLLLEALKKKWPKAVESSYEEAASEVNRELAEINAGDTENGVKL